jgi:phage terminase large subunit
VFDIAGGRGRGGSHFATDYFLFRITNSQYFRGYFMRYIHGDIRGSLYQDFKDRIEEHDEINHNDFDFNDTRMEVVYKPTGNKILSKGFKKSSGSATAKLKSIAGATDIIIEECEEIGEEDFNKLRDSLRTVKGSLHIFRIFNPPQKDHWLIKNYYDLEPSKEFEGYFIATPKDLPGFISVWSSYKDNRKNINNQTAINFEHYKETNIDHYCSDILGLVPSGAKGIIYKQWQKYSELPDDISYRVFAIDWGGTDPNTLIELNFAKGPKRCYVREHLYEPDIRIANFIALIQQVNPDNDEVICDSARRDQINELSSAGINAFKSDKSAINRDFRSDITDLVKEYQLFVHEDSENAHLELNTYQWAIDPNTKLPLMPRKPEDRNNHILDPLGYGVRYYHFNIGMY